MPLNPSAPKARPSESVIFTFSHREQIARAWDAVNGKAIVGVLASARVESIDRDSIQLSGFEPAGDGSDGVFVQAWHLAPLSGRRRQKRSDDIAWSEGLLVRLSAQQIASLALQRERNGCQAAKAQSVADAKPDRSR